MVKSNLKLIIAAWLLLAVATLAALPPLSPEARKEDATDIVVGTVLRVKTAEQKVDPGKDTVSTCQVKVASVEKGKLKANAQIVVTYRQTLERPGGWAGPQGQNEPLVEGSTVRLYLTKSGKSYSLLRPNGWEQVTK